MTTTCTTAVRIVADVAKKELEKAEPQVDERLRRAIWRSLGHKSVRQVSEDTGLPVEVVMATKRELLDEIDSLTIQEHVAKNIAMLSEISELAMSHARGMSSNPEAQRSLGPVLSSAIQAARAVITQMNLMEKATNGQVERLNQKRVDALVGLVRKTVDASVYALDDGLAHTAQEMFGVFNRNLALAAADLEDQD